MMESSKGDSILVITDPEIVYRDVHLFIYANHQNIHNINIGHQFSRTIGIPQLRSCLKIKNNTSLYSAFELYIL